MKVKHPDQRVRIEPFSNDTLVGEEEGEVMLQEESHNIEEDILQEEEEIIIRLFVL